MMKEFETLALDLPKEFEATMLHSYSSSVVSRGPSSALKALLLAMASAGGTPVAEQVTR